MAEKKFLGEFAQMLLLAIMQRDRDAFALEIRNELAESAGRTVSRGTLYKTLDRLETQGYVEWDEQGIEDSKLTQRCYRVTSEGKEALHRSRAAFNQLWRGLDQTVENVR